MSKTPDQPDDNNTEEHEPTASQKPVRKSRRGRAPRTRYLKMIFGLFIVLIVLAILLGLGFVARVRRLRKIEDASNSLKSTPPTVQVVTARESTGTSNLVLPGNVEAIQVTTVGARTSGYLRKWYVDIGGRVRAGQKLADIDTPEVDQSLAQARSDLQLARAALLQSQANLEQARTNMEYARVTFVRYQNLVRLGVVTRQDTDQRDAEFKAAIATVEAMQANVRVSESAINSNQANVRRAADLLGFNRVFAPFAGIITARNVEVGSLIGSNGSASTSASSSGASSSSSSSSSSIYGMSSTGNSGTASPPAMNPAGVGVTSGGLFNIARIDIVRVNVSVPQTYVSSVKPGMTADVAIRELPQRKFTGRVARRADALDPNSRTMLTEVDISNSDFALLPGMYAEVSFHVSLTVPPVQVPSNVVIIRTGGPQVLVVTNDQKLHYQDVELGTDYGAVIDILQGLEPGTSVVANPTDALKEGESVTVSAVKSSPSPSPSPGQSQGGYH